MEAVFAVVTFSLIRLVLPVSIVLLIGDFINRRKVYRSQ